MANGRLTSGPADDSDQPSIRAAAQSAEIRQLPRHRQPGRRSERADGRRDPVADVAQQRGPWVNGLELLRSNTNMLQSFADSGDRRLEMVRLGVHRREVQRGLSGGSGRPLRRRHSGLGQKSPVNFEREQAERSTRDECAGKDGLPNACFAPVDKPPQDRVVDPSACPQAGPLDNPAP